MKKCPKCGKEYGNNYRFCETCGIELENVESFVEKEPVSEIKNPKERIEKPKKGNGKLLAILISLIIVITITLVAVSIILISNMNNSSSERDRYNREDKTETAETTEVAAEETEEAEEESAKLIDISGIDSIIAQDANYADFGVCIIDLENDKSYGTDNKDMQYSASSLINIPVMYTIYKDVQNGSLSLDDKVKFTYRAPGRGNIKEADDGNYYTIRYLMSQMLNYSDNNVINSLIDYLGKEHIEDVCADNYYNSVEVEKYLGESIEGVDNYVSAEDVSHMLYEMYNNKTEGNINKDFITSNFYIVDDASDDGVIKNLPDSAMFLNHNNVATELYHETAIIFDDDISFIITVLSDNGARATSAETTAKIARYVYDALDE